MAVTSPTPSHRTPSAHSRDWRRVVVKIGTNLLTAGTDHLSRPAIERLTRQIALLHRREIEVVLVTSGAVAAGREALHGLAPESTKNAAASRQVLAALGQTPLMQHYLDYFKREGLLAAQALMSRGDLENDYGYLNARNTLLGLIHAGAVPIVNENDVVAVEELDVEAFGDNDRLSARVADVVDADALVILSDVAGLYDKDPHRHKTARRIPEVAAITDEIRAMAGAAGERGRGGMATKIEAAEMATALGTAVVIASGEIPDVLKRIFDGEDLGTLFVPATTKLESRKRRILAALNSQSGHVMVNAGAAQALEREGASLLPPGIMQVYGVFDRGDCIAVRGPDGKVIAAGRTNYSAREVERIKGLRSYEARELVPGDLDDEVIHRDNMVIMDGSPVRAEQVVGDQAETSKVVPDLNALGRAARIASRSLATTSSDQKNRALLALADVLVERADDVLEANARDMKRAASNDLAENLQDRLLLTKERLGKMADGVREVAKLPDPIGEVSDQSTRPNGLRLERRRIPLGVIGVIYESRPNVTIDIAALCLKSGNAVLLRGGSEAFDSNTALASLARAAISGAGLPEDCVQIVGSTDRRLVDQMLNLSQYIDLIIPRGGGDLIRMVAEKAKMPAITGGIGVCHTYVDEDADLDKAVEIVENAKVQRPSVCNALDTVLVHSHVASPLLPRLAERLWNDGVELRCDRRALSVLEPVAHQRGQTTLLKSAERHDFDTEFLGLRAAVAIVDSLDAALDHIAQHGSHHSEAIITENATARDRFLREVDASAVFANASTRFNDGFEFGLGAEVAISTGKLHAYGPMGLKEITTTKWVVVGDGQIRS